MNAQTEADALEYGEHIRSGGWRLGLLVARNVEKGSGQGARSQPRTAGDAKCSIRSFAAKAKVGQARVRGHLDAWNKAAEAGIVPVSDDLTVGQDLPLDIDVLPDWGEFYTPVSGGWNGGEGRTPTAGDVQRVVGAAEPATLTEAFGDPQTRMRVEGGASRARQNARTEARSERRAGGRVSASEAGAGAVIQIGRIMSDLQDIAGRLSDAWEQALRVCSDEQIEAIKGRVATGSFEIGRVVADIQGTGIDAALAEMLKGGVNTDE